MSSKFSFSEIQKKRKRPLILDGATGAILQNDLNEPTSPLWTSKLTLTKPQKVIDLHKSYIDAGADIITTNTFGTNPTAIRLAGSNFDSKKLVRESVKLAGEARGDSEILIAGSNPPAEDCYKQARSISEEELYANHESHIDYLWESGVDFILNETMSHFDEIRAVIRICTLKNIPFIISLYLDDDLELLRGGTLFDSMVYIQEFTPIALGINCIYPAVFEKIDLQRVSKLKWGFYLNCGSGNVTDSVIECGVSPSDYTNEIKKYIKYNPVFIGSCCGSNPSHTKAIKDYLDEIYSN